MANYYVTTVCGDFSFSADLSNAKAPLRLSDGEGGWQSTQYQTADARHDEEQAAILMIRSLGAEWYMEPGQCLDEGESEDDYIRSLITGIEVSEA